MPASRPRTARSWTPPNITLSGLNQRWGGRADAPKPLEQKLANGGQPLQQTDFPIRAPRRSAHEAGPRALLEDRLACADRIRVQSVESGRPGAERQGPKRDCQNRNATRGSQTPSARPACPMHDYCPYGLVLVNIRSVLWLTRLHYH